MGPQSRPGLNKAVRRGTPSRPYRLYKFVRLCFSSFVRLTDACEVVFENRKPKNESSLVVRRRLTAMDLR